MLLAANLFSHIHNDQAKHSWNPTKLFLPGREEGEQRVSTPEHSHTCIYEMPPPAPPPFWLAQNDVTEANIPAFQAAQVPHSVS